MNKENKIMKYKISIPQREIIETFGDQVFEIRKGRSSKPLDMLDMALYDFFYGYCNTKSSKVVKMAIGNEVYVWATYSVIMRELPLLRLKADAIRNRLNKLVNAGLLKKRVETVSPEYKNGFKKIFQADFYTLGEKSDCLHFSRLYPSGAIQEGLDNCPGGALTIVKHNGETEIRTYLDNCQGKGIVCKEGDTCKPIKTDKDKETPLKTDKFENDDDFKDGDLTDVSNCNIVKKQHSEQLKNENGNKTDGTNRSPMGQSVQAATKMSHVSKSNKKSIEKSTQKPIENSITDVEIKQCSDEMDEDPWLDDYAFADELDNDPLSPEQENTGDPWTNDPDSHKN